MLAAALWLAVEPAPAACPIEVGLRAASAAPTVTEAAREIGAAYAAFTQAAGRRAEVSGARSTLNDDGTRETALFLRLDAADADAAARLVAAARQHGLTLTAPAPHPACPTEPGPPPPPQQATVNVVGLCRAAAPADRLEYDAIFPRPPDTAGLTPPALAFRQAVEAMGLGAEIADADTMAPTARAFWVHARHMAAPPPTLLVFTSHLDAGPALVARAHAAGAVASVFAGDIADSAVADRLTRQCAGPAAADARAQADGVAKGLGATVAAALPPAPPASLGPVRSAAGLAPRSEALPVGSAGEAWHEAAPPGEVTLGTEVPQGFVLAAPATAGDRVVVAERCVGVATPDRKRFVFTGPPVALKAAAELAGESGIRLTPVPGGLQGELRRPPLYPRAWKAGAAVAAGVIEESLLPEAVMTARRLACVREAAARAAADAARLLAAVGRKAGPVVTVFGPRPALGEADEGGLTLTATFGIQP